MVGFDELGDRLTIREAATLLNVHPNTIRNRIKGGTYEAEKILTDRGPTYYLSRESLLNNAASQALPSDSQQSASLVSREAELAFQELLPQIVRELEVSREAAAEKEKRDSLRQGATEYWKSSYDFFKHLTILSLAAIAGFGALLGGVFSSETWQEAVVFHFFPMIYLSQGELIFWTFAALFMAAAAGMGATAVARSHLYEVGTLETQDELKAYHAKNHGLRGAPWRNFGFWALSTVITLGVGIAGFGLFVLRSVVS